MASPTDLPLTPDLNAMSPRQGNRLTKAIGGLILRLMGWRITGAWPEESKIVIVGAPHTSNWDLFLALGMMMNQNLRLSWMMKKEAFFWPLGGLWKRLGGIPINRKAAQDVVQQTADFFASRDSVYLGITPEGTRSKVGGFRKGYLRIAQATGAPVFIAGVDARKKTVHLDRLWPLTGDIEADNAAIETYIRENYQGIHANQG